MDYPIYTSVLNTRQYEIKVNIRQDYDITPFECDNGIKELTYNPLPIDREFGEESPFDYTDFAIDNFYHTAYFTTDDDDSWHSSKKRYFMLSDCPKEIQKYYSKQGYSRHNAWLKALDILKFQARYIQNWFSDQWHYVGIIVEIAESFTDKNGLMWSREVKNDFNNSLWGIEWSIYLESGENCTINNKEQFFEIIPQLLPSDVKLTEEELNNLWYNLE